MRAPSALERTFQLVRGLGPWREKDLWAKGLDGWDAFEDRARHGTVMSKGLDRALLDRLPVAREALARQDVEALAAMLPSREHWRLYDSFPEQAVFLDVEADGAREPTVVGVFDALGVGAYVRGRDLDRAEERLARSPVWVTFNGKSFDVPVLRRRFPGLRAPSAHVDLRIVARIAGLKGGLKQLEDQLGLARPPHLRGLGGLDAMRLWNEYRHHQELKGLRLLVEYNLYDVINLRSLLDWCQGRIGERWGWSRHAPGRPFERGDVLYDVSRLVLGLTLEPAGS